MRFARVIPTLVALGLLACSGELRVIDVSDIREPAIAFIVDMEDGAITQLGSAILFNERGELVDGNQNHQVTGSSSNVIVFSQSSLLSGGGLYQDSIRVDELYNARLATLAPDAQPFLGAASAWLPLRFPNDTQTRPAGTGISFSDTLQIELPIERNFSCIVSGTLKDFGAEVGLVSGEVADFNDFSVVSPERVLASTSEHIFDLRLGDPLSTDATGPRFFQVESGMFIGQIQANPRRPSQIWITERSNTGGTLREFLVDDEGIYTTTAEPFLPSLLLALGVLPDGTPVASGSPPSDAQQTIVHIFDGLPKEPMEFPGSNHRQRIHTSLREGAFSLALRGLIVRYEDDRWTTTTLAKGGVAITPSGIAERLVDDTIETWTVGGDALVTRQPLAGRLDTLFVPIPPNFRCQEGGDVVATDLNDIVIYQNRFALAAIDTCSDLLVIDLDNPDCTSIIRYDGPAASPFVSELQLHGDRVWISGDEAVLRYADLKLP